MEQLLGRMVFTLVRARMVFALVRAFMGLGAFMVMVVGLGIVVGLGLRPLVGPGMGRRMEPSLL